MRGKVPVQGDKRVKVLHLRNANGFFVEGSNGSPSRVINDKDVTVGLSYAFVVVEEGIPGLRGYAGGDSLQREESPYRDDKVEKMVVLKKTKMAILVFSIDYLYRYTQAFKRHSKLY
ncbi:hypothetical protein EDB86DRAFT_2832935 [Lactarius hatsudake]|nr:hypothetical protein EDB86DRAFT_2832935 [Lactarius hatsudake]